MEACSADVVSSGSDTDCDSDVSSDSDCSWVSFSSITDDSESDGAVSSVSNDKVIPLRSTVPVSQQNKDSFDCIDVTRETKNSLGYRLCGDNIDKSIKHRYMRSGATSKVKSIHYFNSYASRNRIDSGISPQVHSCMPSAASIAPTLLPSPEDDAMLCHSFEILVSRVLVRYVPFFSKSFDGPGVVTWHIEHKHYTEMSEKSEVVSFI